MELQSDYQGNRYTYLPKLTANRITIMAIILAFRIVISFIPALNFGNLVQIGVGFIGAALSGIILGPVGALILGVVNDVISHFLSGSATFFIGFTLSAAIGGYIYGAVFWRREVTWKRIFIAILLVTLIVNLGLNSLWIRIMYDRAWGAFMGMRVIKNLISLPLNTIILYVIFSSPTVQQIVKKYQF